MYILSAVSLEIKGLFLQTVRACNPYNPWAFFLSIGKRVGDPVPQTISNIMWRFSLNGLLTSQTEQGYDYAGVTI
jgi:hypothetical protein